MTKKKAKNTSALVLSESEEQFIKQLRANPKLKDGFEAILDITRNEGGPLKTADEVEGLLVKKVRQLGQSSMSQWAANAEGRLGEELKKKDPSVRVTKKKS